MNDESQKNAPRQELTFKRIVEFFTQRNVSVVCTACGQSEKGWKIYSEDKESGMGLAANLSLVGDSLNIGGGIVTVPVVCQNCGFVREHSAELILQWLEENDGSGE